jgi:hypothetical protein
VTETEWKREEEGGKERKGKRQNLARAKTIKRKIVNLKKKIKGRRGARERRSGIII